MISITSNWPQYFENPDEGLGTTYERFILHKCFENIQKNVSIQTVLEVPSFGMTGISGINSMWWAFHGRKVTVIDNNRERIELIKKVWQGVALNAEFIYKFNDYRSLSFENDSFDMSWNFAALWFIPELEIFFEELTRVTKKVIFICVPNRSGLGHLIRLAFGKKHKEGFHMSNIITDKIKRIMMKLQWKIEDSGYIDVPPWPDIAMKKGDLLKRIGLKSLAERLNSNENNYICILDYFSGKNRDMEKEILRYAYLEHSPWIVKMFWAHHRYFIFTPE